MARPKKNIEADDVYDGSKIKELPYPECVQQRGQMYIGEMDSQGLSTCIREIINNSVDEFLAGYCTHIAVIQHDEFTFTIRDNGRGVPFDKQADGRNTLQKIFGTLHAGRNFEAKTVYSTGINGVGSSVVNALSQNFEVISQRGTDRGSIRFVDGRFHDVKVEKGIKAPKGVCAKSSTSVTFTFNMSWFEEGTTPNIPQIQRLIQETAYLNSGLTISFLDERQGKDSILAFNYENGISNFLVDEVEKKGIIPVISLESDTINDTHIEVAFCYNSSFASDNISSFCNTIRTSDGGTHVTGFKRALSQKLLAFVKNSGLTKEKIENEDIYVGLEAIVSVFVFNPKYSSQTKQKLTNNDVNGHVFQLVNGELDKWLAENPKEIKVLVQKFALTARSRIAQKRALESVKKESSSFLTSLANIQKFADCAEQMSGRTELFLVEG